jgi:hypothetical protein
MNDKLEQWTVKPGELCTSCQRAVHNHKPEIMQIPADERCPCEGECVKRHPEWGRIDRYLAKYAT